MAVIYNRKKGKSRDVSQEGMTQQQHFLPNTLDLSQAVAGKAELDQGQGNQRQDIPAELDQTGHGAGRAYEFNRQGIYKSSAVQ